MAAKPLPEENSPQQREHLYVEKSNNETLFTSLDVSGTLHGPVVGISDDDVAKGRASLHSFPQGNDSLALSLEDRSTIEIVNQIDRL